VDHAVTDVSPTTRFTVGGTENAGLDNARVVDAGAITYGKPLKQKKTR